MPARKHKDIASMEFKFDADRVNIAILEEYADEQLVSDESILQILIRDTKHGEYGLFMLQRYDGTKEGNEELADKWTDSMKRSFGNGLKGWSLSSRVFTLKGLEL